VAEVLDALALRGIQGGYALGVEYPELNDCLLLCATETKTQADIDYLAQNLQIILAQQDGKKTCVV
jgi:glycine dehydrogenase subunit 1